MRNLVIWAAVLLPTLAANHCGAVERPQQELTIALGGGVKMQFALIRAGQKKPNARELYDMHGSVFEWCADWWAGDYFQDSPAADPVGPDSRDGHVLRGCSFSLDDPRIFRCAFRYPHTRSGRIDNYGFRIVRTSAP